MLLFFFFVTKKIIKTQKSSAWKTLQPPMLGCSRCLTPYLKINTVLCWCPTFFKEYLTPSSGSTKGQTNVVSLLPLSLRIYLMDTSSHVSKRLLQLYLSSIFVEFSIKPAYSTMIITCIFHHYNLLYVPQAVLQTRYMWILTTNISC